ncbi:MAG TPA: zinc metalloprotease HtpX [Rhodospirillaceae bacterium]|nr:zinc metalloprotease HtpX [Rhodospirillaceae bacterium]
MTRISPWDDIPLPNATAAVSTLETQRLRAGPWGPVQGNGANTFPKKEPSASPEELREVQILNDTLNPPPGPRILRTDFFGAIAKNRRNTLLLGILFILLLGSVGYAIGAIIENSFFYPFLTKQYDPRFAGHVINLSATPPPFTALTMPKLLGAGILGGLSILWIFYAFLFGDKVVLKISGAHEITHDEHPMLDNVVTEMALAAGISKPRVFIIESEGLNAFATGMSPSKSAIAVTRGLLRKLNREELQGVVGHETGHIVNADIRYATMLAVAVGILLILGSLMRQAPRLLVPRGGSRRGGKGGGALLVIIILYLFIAILAPIIAKILQAAISRQREYMADATSVQLTRNPKGLIGALQKIDAPNGTFMGSSEAFQHMYFINPYAKFSGMSLALFSTHPPTQKRIDRLANLG